MTDNIRDYCPKCNHPNKKFYYTINKGRKKGYCFHCGYKESSKANYKDIQLRVELPTRGQVSKPSDADSNWGTWPREAVLWVMKYGITQQDCIQHGIFYAQSWGRERLWLTVGDGHYQGRDLTGKDDIKYLTKRNETKTFFIGDKPTCIITEDIVSAIKAYKFGYSALALSGTNLMEQHVKKLLDRKVTNVLVCMDNDNAKVKRLQENIKKRLDNFFNCSIVRLNKDLKEYSFEEFEVGLKQKKKVEHDKR